MRCVRIWSGGCDCACGAGVDESLGVCVCVCVCVWTLQAEVGSFDSVLPLLEKFIIPTFQLRGNAPRQDVFEAEQYRQQQLRIQENAQGASLPHGLLGTGGGRR